MLWVGHNFARTAVVAGNKMDQEGFDEHKNIPDHDDELGKAEPVENF
jgi:hypothetical protein